MRTIQQPIVEKLRVQQTMLGMSDRQFAELLGVSRPLWVQTRDGQLPVGLSLLSGAIRAFPGMRDDVLIAVEHYQARKQTAEVA